MIAANQRFVTRQREIYLQGVAGRRPVLPIAFAALAARAQRIMSRKAFAYVAGGAGAEDTLQANAAAFRRWQIVPRMLRDVETRDTSIELFGRRLPAPLLLAPVGVMEMAHPQAELPVARAAASLGLPMIFSNQASRSMEDMAACMGDSPRWFQLYWSRSNELVESFVRRAEACRCEAIVVTLDTTMLGWRSRDLELAWLPFLHGMGIAQYTSDPVFRRLMEEPPPPPAPGDPPRQVTLSSLRALMGMARRFPGPFLENIRSGRALAAVRLFTNIYTRPSLSWQDLAFLRATTRLPILLKGILHPDDARKALDHGINGIIVSNHGGRQIDGSIGALDALPSVAEALAGRIPLLMDSGVRGGADVFKALALGANAVCLGRPWVYGLALAGEAGVREVLRNLLCDFELSMALAGCRNITDIQAEMLRRA